MEKEWLILNFTKGRLSTQWNKGKEKKMNELLKPLYFFTRFSHTENHLRDSAKERGRWRRSREKTIVLLSLRWRIGSCQLHSLRPANSSLMAQGEPYMLDRNHDKNTFYHRTIIIYQVYIQRFLDGHCHNRLRVTVGLERRQRIKGLTPGVEMSTGYRKSVSL